MPLFVHEHGHHRLLFTVTTATVLASIVGRLAYNILSPAKQYRPRIYRAPRAPSSEYGKHNANDPYPSNALPGARDVDTPYGSIRVNEWGPETGKKVLFVHGISTPSIACGHMALELAERDGCRVMMFDLFGRGYSDATDPFEVKQDIRLFTSQIMLVLASSPLAWTGDGNGFTLIGYSLGGGIAASFTSHFPRLVDTLVLIAPAGLMRASRIQLSSRLIYGGYLPDMLRDYLVRKRIVGPPPNKKAIEDAPSAPPLPISEPEELANDNPEFAPGSTAPLIPNSVASAADSVTWQVYKNPGFLPSFISSIKYAPISNEHDRWRLIGTRLTAQREAGSKWPSGGQGLREGRVLMIFGESDGVVVPTETSTDAVQVLGADNVQIEMLQGGHDVVITNAKGCVDVIRRFWATAE